MCMACPLAFLLAWTWWTSEDTRYTPHPASAEFFSLLFHHYGHSRPISNKVVLHTPQMCTACPLAFLLAWMCLMLKMPSIVSPLQHGYSRCAAFCLLLLAATFQNRKCQGWRDLSNNKELWHSCAGFAWRRLRRCRSMKLGTSVTCARLYSC